MHNYYSLISYKHSYTVYEQLYLFSAFPSSDLCFSCNLSILSLHPHPFNSITLPSEENAVLSLSAIKLQSAGLMGLFAATFLASAKSYFGSGHRKGDMLRRLQKVISVRVKLNLTIHGVSQESKV